MEIKEELIKELLLQRKSGEDLFGADGLVGQLTKRLMEKVLQEELSDHLGYDKGERGPRPRTNTRNGTSSKRLKTDHGELEIEIPRDRNSTFEPKFVKKNQTRLQGFDDRVLSLYSRGMTVREIQGHLEDLYQVKVSPDLISRVTSVVNEDVRAWRQRPLNPIWPIVYLDALVVRIRDRGVVTRKAVYLALGVNVEGTKEVLGMWIEGSEGAKFWLKVVNELKNRGVEDIFLVCCDGLKGFPEAIEAVFPLAIVQTCIVHVIRNSTRLISYKDRRAVSAALKPIYTAVDRDAALAALGEFDKVWGKRYQPVRNLLRGPTASLMFAVCAPQNFG